MEKEAFSVIAFGTGGWRAVIGDGFIKENIQRIGTAVARRMTREGCAEEGICLGYDRRFLSREACIWLAEALAGEGVHVRFVNLSCPTPQIMFTVKHLGLHYGGMVTASHNPAIYNGIKLFTYGGRDASEDVTAPIQEEANALDPASMRTIGFDEARKAEQIEFIDPRDTYLDSILRQIDTDAIRSRRLRVALDPMYGVGLTGLMTILYTARCDVDVINDEHDAFFGRQLPAPTPETLVDLQKAVLAHNANVGIATDGDADRLGIIDEKGAYVSPNEILVLLYEYLLRHKGWKGPAVRNIATTHLLDRVAAAYGQTCYEVPVGFKHISAAMDEHDAVIGGESSGGLTVHGHISGKDGLYAASLLVEMLSVTGKPLSQMVQDVYDRYGEMHTAEFDWALTEADKERIQRLLMVEKKLPSFRYPVEKVSYRDGCKVYFENAWVIVRFSGTEPRVRIFAEDDTIHHAKTLVGIMADFTGLTFDA
uniref:Phosphoglucomutase/phosphomannomutase alpha/beta/alpha domain I n=1 Tax=uncultured bacterium Contig99 TaxID=1393639 RepID=W0FNT1_9BACT|nr:phosphoglucomutase/phosphomannomutase alpha/beta/alpha domain I [uncultured bacterium Contig99]